MPMKPSLNILFNPKKYFGILLFLLFGFVLYHGIVYLFITSKIINIPPPFSVGDLTRMGYQTDSLALRKYEITLPKKHLEGENFTNQKIDILTIGDSFSNGGAGGLNPFYQDYLASKYSYTILNIRPFNEYQEGYLQSILTLLNSGVLKNIHPKAIILEFGARSTITHFSEDFDWNISLTPTNIQHQIADMKINKVANTIPKDIFFINTANYKTLTNTLKFKFKPCLHSGVCRLPLTQDMFSVKASQTLEFYRDDIKNLPLINYAATAKSNANFNHLAILLRQHGIKLYVMPIVDKYDLYEPYIHSNPYSVNYQFNYLRQLRKEYVFIDTKEILSKEMKNGQKDLFFADDTHWSHHASDAITNHPSFKNIHP